MTLKTLHLSNPLGAIAYRESGQGEPLILIHGVGMQSAAWTPQIEIFSMTHRVIAIDMPGHGGSDPLPEGAELPEFVAWLYAVVEALDLGAINIAGHSMGAMISGGFTITHPRLTRRVALLNGVHRRDEAARKPIEARAAEAKAGKIDLETPLARWFGESPADHPVRILVAGWLGSMNPKGYAAAYQAFAHGDRIFAADWPTVSVPMLALTGSEDPNSTPKMSQAMADASQNGEAIVVQGHRHMVNLTAPDEVNHILANWLKRPTPLEKTL